MTDEPEPAAPSGRTISLRSLIVALGGLALVVAVAYALVQRSEVSDLRAEADVVTDVAAAASRFGEVYLTYDSADVTGSRARVLELVSAEFARDFESNRAPGIEELFANLGTGTVATAKQVFVGDLDDKRASALVVVDVEASSEASGTQRLTDLSFVVTLVREDGEWLVDNVLPAPQPDISGDGVDEATTTTTTAVAAGG